MFSKKSTIFAKIETPSGTDSVPTNTVNAVEAYDIDLNPKADMKERYPANNTRSAYAEVRGKTIYELKFSVHLKGSGTAGTAPRYGCLLRACDRLETIAGAPSTCTYTPAITSETCSIYVNIDGILHILVGCAGDAELDLTSGEVPMIKFTFSGVYALATDSVISAPTFDTTTPVIVKGETFTFGSYAAIAEKLLLKFGNKVVERISMNATEGVFAFMVGDRNPSGVLTCELVLRATSNADFLSYFHSGTTKALSLVHGSVAGNIATITAPACLLRAPKIGDRDGLRTVDIEFQCARSSGNDEQSIVLS